LLFSLEVHWRLAEHHILQCDLWRRLWRGATAVCGDTKRSRWRAELQLQRRGDALCRVSELHALPSAVHWGLCQEWRRMYRGLWWWCWILARGECMQACLLSSIALVCLRAAVTGELSQYQPCPRPMGSGDGKDPVVSIWQCGITGSA